jgi:drug/metabolite transporter (DMT)-like permease
MNLQKKKSYSHLIVLTFGIFAVSTASILIRFAQNEAPSLVIAAYRLRLATLILSPFAVKRSIVEVRELTRKQTMALILSGIFLAVHFASWITSLEYTSVTSSVVLVTTTPLWVAILSPLILGERSRKEVWIGLTFAMLGGVIVALRDICHFGPNGFACEPIPGAVTGRGVIGNFLALFGAFMAAGYMIVGRQLRPRFSLISYTFIVYGIAAVFLCLFVLIGGYSFVGYSRLTCLWFLLLGIVPQIFGHSSFNWALKYLPAAFVSLALLGEPVGTTILAVLLLREVPTTIELTGGLLILAGIFLASRSNTIAAGQRSSVGGSIQPGP